MVNVSRNQVNPKEHNLKTSHQDTQDIKLKKMKHTKNL